MPKYWDDVKDPTVAQYFRITSKTHVDEYERVLGSFMLTLDPSTSQCIHQIVAARLAESAPDSLIDLRTGAFTIHSVDRVQNLSLWKTYAAKRAATCSREEDPEKARRRFVRAWLFHGCSSNLAPKILQQGFNRSFCGKHANFFGRTLCGNQNRVDDVSRVPLIDSTQAKAFTSPATPRIVRILSTASPTPRAARRSF